MRLKYMNYLNLLFQAIAKLRGFCFLFIFVFVLFSDPAYADSFFHSGIGGTDPVLFANARGTDPALEPKTLGSPLDKQKMTEYRQLNFRHQVAQTNLWFFPVAALGSGGLGFLFIQIPPDKWWQTIVYVYGWAGIGAAAVAVGLSFYAIYDYYSTKNALKKFQQANHLSYQRPNHRQINPIHHDYSVHSVYFKEVCPYISGKNGSNEIFFLRVFRATFG